MNSTVSVISCKTYELEAVRAALRACLAPLGGMEKFVRPGMRVLLKPNLLSAASPEQAVTTHPALVQAAVELVRACGGEAQIGDSPAGPTQANPQAWRKTGMTEAAEASGAALVLFDSAAAKQAHGLHYLVARPVLEADLVINLPKLKTHQLTLYTGAVKNLFGTVVGTRKSEIHVRAIGVQDFSRELVNLLELVRPGLTIMDGVCGLEGKGPGVSGTPHAYGCLAASADPVALDTLLSRAMGFRAGDVLHLAQAGERGLGCADLEDIRVEGERAALAFGRLHLPAAHWYLRVPAWVSRPAARLVKLQPVVDAELCNGCKKCAGVCASQAITAGCPPQFDLERCIGCMCCAEVCPQGALDARRSPLARLMGIGN